MAKDARSLTAQELTALRIRGVKALRQGCNPTAVAKVLGVARSTVYGWKRLDATGGLRKLTAKSRGTRGQRILTPLQEREIRRWVRTKQPRDVGLVFGRWTRAAVQALIQRRCGVLMPERTVGSYLQRWRFSPKKAR